MKKYITGLMVFGLMFSSFSFASTANAGAFTSAQISNVILMLQQYGASSSTLSSITNILNSSSASSTSTSNTTGTSSGTSNPCAFGPFNIVTGAPCTSAGTSSGTSSGTTPGTVNPNANYPFGTIPTSGNPNTPTNGCYSNQTAVYPYNINNGYPCVKVCPVLTTSANMQNYWNVLTNSLCPIISNPNNATSVTVVAPNGAEVYSPGETIGVKWSTVNIPSTNEYVFLILNEYTPAGVLVGNVKLINGYTINDGGEAVKLPTDLLPGASWGNNFTVTVGAIDSNGNSLGSDNSDKNFIIQ